MPAAPRRTWYIPLSTDAQVLDVGCGVGALTRKIADAGYVAIGADTAPRSVAVARDKFGVDCAVGGPYEAFEQHGRRPFDGAVANLVFHCVERPETLFEEVSNVLAPGSPLLLSVPGAMWSANHEHDLVPVGDVVGESFTQHEVVRKFQASGIEYAGSAVHYFLYDSNAVYLHLASRFFDPVAHTEIATPLDEEAYGIGEAERLSSAGGIVASLPDIDLFVLRKR